MWPMDDSTSYAEPRKLAMVLALAGDSTMTSGLGMASLRLGGRKSEKEIQRLDPFWHIPPERPVGSARRSGPLGRCAQAHKV